jgi:hypothetical protein
MSDQRAIVGHRRHCLRHQPVAGHPSPMPLVGLLLLLPPSATAAAASASAPRLAAAAQLPGCGDEGREQGSDPGMGQLAAPVMRLMLVTSSSRSDSCSTRLSKQQEHHQDMHRLHTWHLLRASSKCEGQHVGRSATGCISGWFERLIATCSLPAAHLQIAATQ